MSKNEKEFYGRVFRSCGLRWIDYRIGNNNVFLRNRKIDIINEKLKDDFQTILNRCKRLRTLGCKWRFVILVIIARVREIRKSPPVEPPVEPVQDRDESYATANKKRKQDTSDNSRVELPKRMTITIPTTITTEERLRKLLRQERGQHTALKTDYSKLQKQNLELIAKCSTLNAENQRILDENRTLRAAMQTSRNKVLSDHNYY